MNTQTSPIFIAFTGGSGAGKTWLVDRLRQRFGNEATSLSLDDFYLDLSYLSVSERKRINFDDPDAIDWSLLENTLRELRNGKTTLAPRYDYDSHTRRNSGEWCSPHPFIFVEGLWLLSFERVREYFTLGIFLDCPDSLRRQRRLTRDVKERGRTEDSINEQIRNFVAPMHERFVEPQKSWADRVMDQPISPTELEGLVTTIRALQPKPHQAPFSIINSLATAPVTPTQQYL